MQSGGGVNVSRIVPELSPHLDYLLYCLSLRMKETYDQRRKMSRTKCRRREAQKTLRTEVKFAISRCTIVMATGISSRFIQDRPARNKSPINTPRKTQGMSNATTKVVLIRDHNSIFSKALLGICTITWDGRLPAEQTYSPAERSPPQDDRLD